MRNKYYIDKIFQELDQRFSLNLIEKEENSAGIEESSYALTMIRTRNNSTELSERINQFYEFLKRILLSGDKIDTSNKCFTIISDEFRVSFYVEGFKCADKRAYWSNAENCIKVELLNRMGIRNAIKYCRRYKLSIDKIRFNMLDADLKKRIPSADDRFVYLVKNEYVHRKISEQILS